MTTPAPFSWDSPTFGHPDTCVHVAAWAADGRHDDETGDW